jgi:FtsH-binding integral membrane protein
MGLVVAGSLLLPVAASLGAAAWVDFWNERSQYAVLALVFSFVALAGIALGVVGLRVLGRGMWAAPVIVLGALAAIASFLRGISTG